METEQQIEMAVPPIGEFTPIVKGVTANFKDPIRIREKTVGIAYNLFQKIGSPEYVELGYSEKLGMLALIPVKTRTNNSYSIRMGTDNPLSMRIISRHNEFVANDYPAQSDGKIIVCKIEKRVV